MGIAKFLQPVIAGLEKAELFDKNGKWIGGWENLTPSEYYRPDEEFLISDAEEFSKVFDAYFESPRVKDEWEAFDKALKHFSKLPYLL